MTGYERINAVLNQKLPDRTPSMLHCFMPAVREMGITMEEYRSNPENIADAHIAMARKYHLDGLLMDIDTCVEAAAIGVPVDYPKDIVARVTGPMSDDLEYLIDEMDPEKLLKCDRIKIMLESVNIAKKKVGGELFVRGNCDQMAFSLAMLAYGMSEFLEALLDEDQEEQIFRLLDRAYDVHLAFHKMMNEAGADCTSFGDSPCGPDVVSRACYEKYAYPYHKRLKQDLDTMGIRTICHICGNLDKIIDDVADIGFAGVEVDYKTNIENAARVFRGKSAFFGPLDPSSVFYLGTPEKVALETRKVLDIFQGRNLVIGAGCAMPKDTSEENLRAFEHTVLNYRIV